MVLSESNHLIKMATAIVVIIFISSSRSIMNMITIMPIIMIIIIRDVVNLRVGMTQSANHDFNFTAAPLVNGRHRCCNAFHGTGILSNNAQPCTMFCNVKSM